MADIGKGIERRVFPRVDIERDVNGSAGLDVIEGAVSDVSIGGIALRTDAELEIGQLVVLEIDDMSPVAGEVFRATENGFVITLDLDLEDEDKFIAEVMQIQNNLDPETL
ncbi:MAG: PilZ domain-containing protein [Rhodospirillales bacterium]|nr:PilZ domain-containing protein [Rhodospirillales bacterium]